MHIQIEVAFMKSYYCEIYKDHLARPWNPHWSLVCEALGILFDHLLLDMPFGDKNPTPHTKCWFKDSSIFMSAQYL